MSYDNWFVWSSSQHARCFQYGYQSLSRDSHARSTGTDCPPPRFFLGAVLWAKPLWDLFPEERAAGSSRCIFDACSGACTPRTPCSGGSLQFSSHPHSPVYFHTAFLSSASLARFDSALWEIHWPFNPLKWPASPWSALAIAFASCLEGGYR